MAAMCRSRGEPSTAAAVDGVVHGRHGRFRYNPFDIYIGGSLARYGEYSEVELALLLSLLKPGGCVVEAGANIGAMTVPIARHVGPNGRVYAFEPQAVLFDLLEHNIRLNGLENVEVHGLAVSDRAETLWHRRQDYCAPGNFGGVEFFRTAEGETAAAAAVRLDAAIDPPRLHLLKLDVEGMEREALAGARGLIDAHRPLIYMENDRRERSADLLRDVFALDYLAFWHLPPLYNPDNFFGVEDNVFGGVGSINMLCVPAERNIGESAAAAIRDPEERPIVAEGRPA